MRTIDLNDDHDHLSFAKRAADCFARNDGIKTYTDNGQITQGEYFAIRWGLGSDCVVVIKVDEYFEPLNYVNIVKGPL